MNEWLPETVDPVSEQIIKVIYTITKATSFFQLLRIFIKARKVRV